MDNIEYLILRSERKSISIEVCADEKIIVRAPLRCSVNIIEQFVNEKNMWINEKLKIIRKRQENLVKRNYVNGEMFKLMGVQYPLKLVTKIEGTIKASFDKDKFIINNVEDKSEIKDIMIKLYRKLAREILSSRTIYYSKIINVEPNKISIKEQKTMWGSCSSKNNINYNWRIIMAPSEIIDYLVVHELCHIRYRDHSKNFWREVEKYIPNYEKRRTWLKKYGMTLNIDYIYENLKGF